MIVECISGKTFCRRHRLAILKKKKEKTFLLLIMIIDKQNEILVMDNG